MECCPRCCGVCNCKACLRQEQDPKPLEFSERQKLLYAEHILRCCGPLVKDTLAALDVEVCTSISFVPKFFSFVFSRFFFGDICDGFQVGMMLCLRNNKQQS